ncbi:WD40 repeat domain-containing protein [Nostoc sp. TCL26-01]|uniref:WD40 repeat domain-containing protein n=1 Tax=Nostoc sp. TCL26-01 TaxID=2576904 RepID=UPI0015B9388A|nr:WD40 repeat domain-containing protein [Nostoc sp. TCL26-01]QLE57665.1 WD40 repeat domain-containing protein [Nostoc sp. TCL26-01]
MTPLRLGQLIHTSFPFVGFRTVASPHIPTEIQQTFLEKVVYQYWDSYNPPSPGYRAAYLHQVTLEHTLFGWLYNDGLDDFGRSDVPYFICYYLAGKLQPSHLENILICLCTGPVRLIDRHNIPDAIDSLVVPDLWSYQPAQNGVKIPSEIIEQSQHSLQQRKLLNLFVFTVEEKIQDTLIADRNLLSVIKPKTSTPVGLGGTYPYEFIQHTIIIQPENIPSFTQDFPLVVQSVEDYQQILLEKIRSQDYRQAIVPTSKNLTVMLGIIISITSLITVLLGVQYFLQVKPFAPQNQPNTIPNSGQNPASQSQNLRLSHTLIGHTDAVWSVIFSNDGKTVVSGSTDKTIKVWNLDTGEVISTLRGHRDVVRAMALSHDGQTLISGSGDKTIKIWDFQTLKLKRTLSHHASPVWSVAISPDGQTLVSGHEDGTINIWNFPTGQLLRTIKGHEGRVFSVAMSPDGETFATGGIDKTIKIWGLYTGDRLRTLAQYQDAVRSVIFSRDGQMLASASWDQTIKIWQVRTGEVLHTLRGHTSRVVTLALGLDGKTLISGSLDNSVKVWNIQTGKLLQTLTGHTDWILAIATNSEKRIIVSASKDKTIQIWTNQ